MTQATPDWASGLVEAVRAAPGASTRELSRATGISEWTADYHLRRLLREGVLTTEMVGRRRSWYAAGCGLCPVLRGALPALRRPEARALAMAADELPETLPRLAARAAIPLGTARWVASVLTDTFLFERTRMGRVSLRHGASMCVTAATEGRRCDLWGKCAVSRAWARSAGEPAPHSLLEERRSRRSQPA